MYVPILNGKAEKVFPTVYLFTVAAIGDAGGTALTKDLQKVFEEHSGKALGST